jgi:BspA type Leucine rich repeat region (6 copies)
MFTTFSGVSHAMVLPHDFPCGTGVTYHVDGAGILTDGKACTDAVVVSNSVTSIGINAFSFPSALTSIVLPVGVTTIGDGAFSGAFNLASITIPDSVTTIGDGAFQSTNLSSLVIPSGVTTIGVATFSNMFSLASVTIPNGVTTIGNNAFACDHLLTSITLPGSITSIGNTAFYCTGLTSIVIPSGVTAIAPYTFGGNPDLTSVTIPNGVTSIGNGAFENDTNLSSITLPSSLLTIGNSAFVGNTSLSSVIIPNGVTSIGNDAFKNNTSLTTFTIPSSVASIGTNAFAGATALVCARYPNPTSLTALQGITRCVAAPTFTLSATSETATAGSAITGYVISSTGGIIASFAITPAIGNGLSFSTSAGLISGTPLAAASVVTYTITAHNATAPDATRTFAITVNASVPPPPAPVPDPVQQSRITSSLVMTTQSGSTTPIVISGSFIETVGAITINNLSLAQSSWTQSGTSVSLIAPFLNPGKYLIQIFNGSAPVLPEVALTVIAPPQVVTSTPVVIKKVRSIYLRCVAPGHSLRIVYGLAPQCPAGYIKG